jgi:Tfp pilus assembly protein PilX
MRTLHHQQGITLFMSLIMLVILTMLALTSFNVSQTNLQVVSNMQQRDAALFAARSVIEEIVSNTRFMHSPERTLPGQPNCSTDEENKRCLDINGDSTFDVTVEVTEPPSCIKTQNLKNSRLNLETEELACSIQASQEHGTKKLNTGNSLCADSIWEVEAQATDNVSEATATITQGIKVLTDTDTLENFCK